MAIRSVRRVSIPPQPAMARFWATARMFIPKVVQRRSATTPEECRDGEDDGEEAVPCDDEVAHHRHAARDVERLLELQVLGAEA